MKKIVFAMLSLSIIASLVGCHAEADVDHPHSVSHVVVGQ